VTKDVALGLVAGEGVCVSRGVGLTLTRIL